MWLYIFFQTYRQWRAIHGPLATHQRAMTWGMVNTTIHQQALKNIIQNINHYNANYFIILYYIFLYILSNCIILNFEFRDPKWVRRDWSHYWKHWKKITFSQNLFILYMLLKCVYAYILPLINAFFLVNLLHLLYKSCYIVYLVALP